MKRLVFNLAAVMSALLCLALAVAWPLSHWRDAQFGIIRPWFTHERFSERTLSFHSSNAGLLIGWYSAYATPAEFDWSGNSDNSGRWEFIPMVSPDPEYPRLSREARPGVQFLGFGFGCKRFTHFGDWHAGYALELIVPQPVLLIVFAVVPVLAVRAALRRRKEQRRGFCPKCSYDLRAHAAGAMCPECGTVVAKLS